MPAVSIVIPAHNAEPYLAQTIESALNQSFQDIEIVVVDDGSTDRTAEIAEQYAHADNRIHALRQGNLGASGGRNHGWEASSPDSQYLLFLDADDLLEPDALETLLAAHREHPSAMLVFGLATFIDSRGSALDSSRRMYWTYQAGKPRPISWDTQPPSPATFAALLYDNCIRTPGVALVPRATLQQVGIFDLAIRGVEDWDLWLRIARRGELVSIPQRVLKYRIHGTGVSSQQERMQAAEMVMRLKMFQSAYGLSDHERRVAVESLEFRYLDHAASLPAIEDARRLAAAAVAIGEKFPLAAAGLGAPDILKRDLALLIALGGSADLLEKILAWAEGKGVNFSPDEIAAMRTADRSLMARSRRLRARRALGLLRSGRLVSALSELLQLSSSLLERTG